MRFRNKPNGGDSPDCIQGDNFQTSLIKDPIPPVNAIGF